MREFQRCPYRNVIRVVGDGESSDPLSDEGPWQTDLVGASSAAPIESGARSGKPPAAPADQRPAANGAEEAFPQQRDRRGDQPFQRRKTFLRNHADGIVAMDLFVVRSGCSSAFSSCGMTGAAFYGRELPRTDRRLDCSPADGGIRLGSGFRGTSSAIETGLTAT
jgi:hypothetical protein